jgi:hypothetical protein
MNKAVLSAALLLFTAACLPLTPAPQPSAPSPVVDQAETAQAMLKAAIIQTLTALPSNSPNPVLSPATSTSTQVVLPSDTATMTATMNATTATATFIVLTSTSSSTALPVGSPTATLTPGVLTYGTLPPAIPFANITLINRAKTKAYISLQVVTQEGGPTIIEYPVAGKIRLQAPVGSYLYVAWVGGRKMVGEFKLHHDDDLDITLYRDRIEIQ